MAEITHQHAWVPSHGIPAKGEFERFRCKNCSVQIRRLYVDSISPSVEDYFKVLEFQIFDQGWVVSDCRRTVPACIESNIQMKHRVERVDVDAKLDKEKMLNRLTLTALRLRADIATAKRLGMRHEISDTVNNILKGSAHRLVGWKTPKRENT